MAWLTRMLGLKKAGSDAKSAIAVGSVGEEYAWMRQFYPGFEPAKQSLQKIDGKPFDVLTWVNSKGEEATVYFDISSFFGKY